MPILVIVCAATAALGVFASHDESSIEATFVGEKKCKKCHIKQHKTWRDTGHATAFDCLEGEDQNDPKCVKCHTTGYDMGGFASVEESGHLLNVQCEQCHGPGSIHTELMSKLKKEKVEKDKYPKEKQINRIPTGCTKCHNPHIKHAPVEKK